VLSDGCLSPSAGWFRTEAVASVMTHFRLCGAGPERCPTGSLVGAPVRFYNRTNRG